jgi:hypothetical protein
MSDDGYGGGGGDYDYESGPGCVTKKEFSSLYFINHALLNSDLMMEHLCVSFFCSVNLCILSGWSFLI